MAERPSSGTARRTALLLFAGAAAAVLAGWDERFLRALFLPHNLHLTLHGVELALLVVLVLDLGARFYRNRRARLFLQLSPQGTSGAVQGVFHVRGVLVFGSRPGPDGVTLPGPQVSRCHLEARRDAAGRLLVADLDSTNGTFLAGEDLRQRREPAVLEPGDRLELGRGGPVLRCVAVPARGLLPGAARILAWLGLLWTGLYLGWRANLENLPADGVTVGRVSVDFAAFRAGGPMVWVGAAASLAGLLYFPAPLRRAGFGRRSSAGTALLILLALGLVLLYPLLPAVAQRYARAAGRAFEAVESAAGAGAWTKLEHWEDAGGEPRRALKEIRRGGSPETPLPDLGLAPEALAGALRRYDQGRAALRWATNLAARTAEPLAAMTYFRQAFGLIAAFLLGLGLPQWVGALRQGAGRFCRGLRRPLSVRLIRAADHGRPLARLLRPVAYWDVVCGFLAAAVVALTLWSPFGTSLGRGKSLYLALPGIPTVQSVELVKAFFVLFVTGYFARQGALLARVARRRYLVPYALAALGTLALTGVQADMGALFMLGLFLGLVFVAATGHLRLVLWVPLLLLPGLGLAALLGLTSVVTTRVGIWLAARTHPLGEQLVQARQLLLSSGWTGFPPQRQMAWQIPDVQGDLVFAACGERYGLLGLLALVGCWFFLVASLLRAARRAAAGAAVLLASVAALVLVQVLTQAGGIMGLLPLTGVPIPWLSHGLTASLVFTFLAALALAAPDRDEAAAPQSTGADPLRYPEWANRAAAAALAALAVLWTVALPLDDRVGRRGHRYLWEDAARRARIDGWIADGLFEPAGRGPRVRLSEAGQRHPEPGQLRTVAEALRYSGKIEPLAYAVSNPNRFAGRAAPRGALTTRDGVAVALAGDGGRRRYPLAASFFHPVGYSGPLAVASGIEAAGRDYLAGFAVDRRQRLQAFLADVHHGPDLELTLDAGLQQAAFAALDGRRGAVVAMDLDDGALLVLASSPAVDPGAADLEAWRGFARRDDRPLRQRSIRSTDAYSPPGSVFKVVVAAAALDSGEIDPREKVHCPGRDQELRVACAHGHAHGPVDLERALVASCNVYFARAAVRLGAAAVAGMAARFGFNEADPPNLLRGVPYAELPAGPSTVDVAAARSERDLARVGFGQGPVSATPLQVARMGAVVATGGELVDPFLARGLALVRRGADGAEPEAVWRHPGAGPSRRRAIPRHLAETLHGALTQVFARGTARRLEKLWWHPREGWLLASGEPRGGWQRVGVAGKTGSAWKTRRDRSDDSWMVAWAPAEAPRVVVSVLVEDAGEGSKVAGPIAVRLLRDALGSLGHRP